MREHVGLEARVESMGTSQNKVRLFEISTFTLISIKLLPKQNISKLTLNSLNNLKALSHQIAEHFLGDNFSFL